jgi:protein involved in polysaccharide export with SLBB domain
MRTLVCTALSLVLAACAAPPFDAKAVALEWAAYMQRDYSLRPGDKLTVRIEQLGADPREQANEQEVVVSPTGTIDLRLLPAPVQVAGRSIGAVRTLVNDEYKKQFANPRVSVNLREAALQSVYVSGEVARGGAQPYQTGMTMTQAVAAAGGFAITVKESDVRVLRIATDGTQRTFRVNMAAVLRDEQPDFLLLPGDIVYCQTSTIADLGNIVELYIRRLLPFAITGVSVGKVGN